jgi:DNA-binding NtrC family response regulator
MRVTKLSILIVEREASARQRLKTPLLPYGYTVVEALEPTDAIRSFHRQSPDLILVNASLQGDHDGLTLARHIRQQHNTIPLILLTANGSEELAIAALRAGITDYIKLPVAPEELLSRVEVQLSSLRRPSASGSRGSAPEGGPYGAYLVGDSPSMQQIKAYIGKVAATDTNVLITGETGTGKELVAELIQHASSRRAQSFVCINCAAIPDTLLESELFGYEKGAFTGASTPSEGKLKLADGGSIFFDEIGDMSPYAQAKILRAIESREVYRLGGKRRIPLNVRMLAATNHDLEQLVAQGQFRKDLYFRLNVARIHLPPLRERKEDILALSHYYLHTLNQHFGRHVEGFTDEVLARLICHDWPGNVRELKNLLEATFVNDPSQRIALADLPEPFSRQCPATDRTVSDERQRLLSALFSTNWNVSKAAQQLHWSRMTIYRKLEKYHIVKGGTGGEVTIQNLPKPTVTLARRLRQSRDNMM